MEEKFITEVEILMEHMDSLRTLVQYGNLPRIESLRLCLVIYTIADLFIMKDSDERYEYLDWCEEILHQNDII